MTFRETIKNIITFYEEFDGVFKKVDDFLQETTDIGGKKDESINAVVCSLSDFQATCYKDMSLSKGRPEEYVSIDERIKKIRNFSNELDEYVKIIKDLQCVVRNSLINDTEWQGQQICIQIINTILETFSVITTCADEQTASYYAAVRILRELVADCSITICALQPLSKWSYGTSEYAQLNAEDQLLVLLNQAILIDRMYFCLYSLEIILERLDKAISSFQKLDWYVYYVAGFLNFKIHKYSNAREYFYRVIYAYNQNSHKEENDNLYFRSMLFIAYSYEYSGEFGSAIEQLISKPEEINIILEKYEIYEIDTKLSEIMDQICKIAKSNSMVKYYIASFSSFCIQAERNSKEDKEQLERQFEILHALGHCLNEYAIKHKKNSINNDQCGNSINNGKILCLARKIMYKLAQYRIEYLTCYATIHGEYQDYHQALVELELAEKTYSKVEKFHGKETLEAEVKFFKYYFGLLCNQMFEDDKKKFESYYSKYDDDDAECYLKIFEFRNELRKYLAALYSDIRNVEDVFLEENLAPVSEILQMKYKGLCKLNPTLYMNVNVRAELRLMQRAYICVCKLREYLISPTPERLLDLRNASYRFLCVKRDFSLISNGSNNSTGENLSQDVTYNDFHLVADYDELPEIVIQAFSGKASVLNCLFNTDSIFILAPISGVVVFQYQTGTISKLFDLEDRKVIPCLGDVPRSSIGEVANALFDIYSDMSAHYDQRKLAKINWNSLKKFTSVIYYWDDDVPSQIIVTKMEKASYIRQIVDMDTFSSIIKDVRNEFDNMRRIKCTDLNKHRNVRCTFQVANLPWMEIINEEEEKDFVIIWDDSNNFSCFIVPYSADIKQKKHDVHKIIRAISIEYDSIDVVSNSDSYDTFEDMVSLCSEIRVLIQTKKSIIHQRVASTQRRIVKFEGDVNNENAIYLKEKNKEEIERLAMIEKIEQRLNEEYRGSTIEQAKRDLLDLSNWN